MSGSTLTAKICFSGKWWEKILVTRAELGSQASSKYSKYSKKHKIHEFSLFLPCNLGRGGYKGGAGGHLPPLTDPGRA